MRIDYRKQVQYELMRGREAVAAVRACPIGYLPLGCLERHGDHLPMGLDTLKARAICVQAAQAIGGVVFPPCHYAGVHMMTPESLKKYTGEWGNIYADATAEAHVVDIVEQLRLFGVKVLVLYSGHYPECQVDMLARIAARFNAEGAVHIIPFWEAKILDGDHAGLSETSFLLYLRRDLVNMTAIGPENYADHHWSAERAPEKATAAKGEADTEKIVAFLKGEIEKVMPAVS